MLLKRSCAAAAVLAVGLFALAGCKGEGGQETRTHGVSENVAPVQPAPTDADGHGEHMHEAMHEDTHEAPATQPEASAYPLDVCIVSGQKLGAMGPPVIYRYEGREVRFCCSGCIDLFNKDPAKYLAKLDAAAAKQGAMP